MLGLQKVSIVIFSDRARCGCRQPAEARLLDSNRHSPQDLADLLICRPVFDGMSNGGLLAHQLVMRLG